MAKENRGCLFSKLTSFPSFLPPPNPPSPRKLLSSSCSVSPQHTISSKSRKFEPLAESREEGAALLLLLPLLLVSLLLSVDLLLLHFLFLSLLGVSAAPFTLPSLLLC